MMLFVAGLPPDFDDTDLKEMFELYGEVKSARMVLDKATGKSKCFGFLDMPNTLEAKETIETLNGVAIRQGKKIVVQESEDRPKTNTYGQRNNNRPPNTDFNRRY